MVSKYIFSWDQIISNWPKLWDRSNLDKGYSIQLLEGLMMANWLIATNIFKPISWEGLKTFYQEFLFIKF